MFGCRAPAVEGELDWEHVPSDMLPPSFSQLAPDSRTGNVLAHVADLNGFVAGVAALLKDTGVAVFEVPYVKELVERCEFDTIYHEHLCYFSVTALHALCARQGLPPLHAPIAASDMLLPAPRRSNDSDRWARPAPRP